jgi:hypothetical protein
MTLNVGFLSLGGLIDNTKEDLKKEIEKNGLVCNYEGMVYRAGAGTLEDQFNYNKYFEYLEYLNCRKLYYL